jgi:hypothetical protein
VRIAVVRVCIVFSLDATRMPIYNESGTVAAMGMRARTTRLASLLETRSYGCLVSSYPTRRDVSEVGRTHVFFYLLYHTDKVLRATSAIPARSPNGPISPQVCMPEGYKLREIREGLP